MNEKLVQMGKERFEKFISAEVARGEKREDIRLVNIDWEDKELKKCLNEMIQEGKIKRTSDIQICIVTEIYFKELLNQKIN